MAILRTKNSKVVGITATLPKEYVSTEETAASLGIADIKKIVAMTGISGRYVAPENICTSDLCCDAAERLMADLGWNPSTVDGIIFVTQTPDYRLPATACVLQRRLGLSTSCAAFDVNQGCSGYVYGLGLASSLINSGLRRVLLLVGDTSTKNICSKDKSSIFLFGDAGTATAIERGEQELVFLLGTDGSGASSLIIPAGGYREYGDDASHKEIEQEGGNLRSRQQLFMNGAEVVSFTLRVLPDCWQELLANDCSREIPIDSVVMHQANQFLLNTVSKRLGIAAEKVPSTLARFGNTSSASIPLTMAETLKTRLQHDQIKLALLGFGVGWSWAGCLGSFGPLTISPTNYI
jgi:3-oxoacyl-[acyl-carrier-protein] synthase-3